MSSCLFFPACHYERQSNLGVKRTSDKLVCRNLGGGGNLCKVYLIIYSFTYKKCFMLAIKHFYFLL